MKQKLLSLVALAGAMFMSASAWAVDPPVEVEPAYTTEWVAPEDGGVYFLYNVGADQYLGAGNHWGTHVVTATVSDESLATVYYWDAGIALSGGSADMNVCVGVLPVQLTKTEDGSFYIQHLGSNRADRYLTSEDGNSWIDGNLSRSAKFNIVAVEGGYTIQATNTAEAGTFFGAADPAPEEQPEEGMEVVRNVMNNLTEGQNIIWRFAPTNYVQCMAYEVRLQFYDKIVEAEEEGVSTTAAEAVYNNPNATADEIKAAINELTVAINKQKFATLLAGATDDDPIEATEYVLQNPTFDEGVDGWFITVTGQNLGWQNRTDTNPNTGASINKFIEAWIPSPGVLGDGVVAQTVYGLPAGKYVLELDATACHDPASGDGTDIEGVYVFIQSGESEKRTPVKTIRLGVEHFAVTYVHDGSDELTFGLKVEGTNANWISADNFQIYYYGKTERTLAQAELEQAIKEAENVDTNVPANADDLEALEKSIEEATTILNSNPDDETALAARDAVKAATDAFNASAKAYQEFDVYFGTGGEFEGLLEQVLENEGWTELADAMDKYNTELQTKFISNTLTTEEINESQDHVQQLILDFIQGDNVKPGDDLTLLLKNPGFENGLKGWTLDRGDAWTVFNGVDYHEVESWHQNFDLYQVIPNMPAGVYTISVQGFARLDDGLTETTIELYAGNSTASFPSISRVNGSGPDEYSEEILYDAASFGDTPIDMDGQTVYVPNGMAGAQVYFGMDNPLTGKPFYQREVKINLREDGDLRIGVRSNSTHEWVLWDNMKITYAGNTLELYYQMIEEAQEKMMAAVNAENAFVTKAATTKVNDLNGRVDKMEELETADQALALIAEIEAATKYIQAGAAKGTALQDAIDLYNELSGVFSTSDSALPALLSNAQQQKNDPATIESNEAVDDIIASFKKAWGTYVTFDAADEPTEKYDATYAIFNYNYFHPVKAENSSEGWTVENIGGAYAANFSELEAFNNDTIYIHQTIEGLKPGFYEVNLQGYYRAGYSSAYNGEQGDSLKQIQHAYIYATTSLGEMTTPLRNAIDQSEIQEMTLGAGSETAVKNLEGTEMYIPENMEAAATYLGNGSFENGCYPNSLKVQVGEDGVLELAIRKWSHIDGDWTIFTNWQLFYLGKTGQNFSDELTAVQGVESTNAKAAQIFTLDGRQAARLNRGINIVRMSDGSVHKVMVK